MNTLHFNLKNQALQTGANFPECLVEKSSNYNKMVFSNLPIGYSHVVYFTQSWDYEKTYKRPLVDDYCVVPEQLLTLPEHANDYIDYYLRVSIVGEKDGERYTTSTVDIIVKKTNYSENAVPI
jgi:hypothetical protein